MILPRPRVVIARPTACATTNGATRLISSSDRKSSGREVEERSALLRTGVVDQDLDRPDVGLDAVDHRLHLVGVGDVAGVPVRSDAGGGQGGCRRFEGR